MKHYGMFVLLAALLAACAPIEIQVTSDSYPEAGAQPASDAAPTTVVDVAATAVLDADDQARQASTEPVIVFKRGGGFAGVSEEWTVYADGRVIPAGGAVHTLPAETVSTLLAGIEALGFFEMNDAYGRGGVCNDCFLYEISVTHAGQTKTVNTRDAAPDAPPELGQVLDKITVLLTSLPDISPTGSPQ